MSLNSPPFQLEYESFSWRVLHTVAFPEGKATTCIQRERREGVTIASSSPKEVPNIQTSEFGSSVWLYA